ncbi:hypothetical protein VHA01S_030_00120 [Vibrio halioticoli NBRC 102217]|uniref:Uncharacterized protein n=1 Tax=Vibrio halioticoli NBRC 102217 TaxID=1219072 RepID=V5FM57_9VIBR|nr:hypothetical protein [Vibrio halioticoli]GAD89937.1 hypothetical protein VHA01S_030_00120 [Vibrio halioticoli NBRC 102217]
MNRRDLIKLSILAPMLSIGILGTGVQAQPLSSLENGLTFFSDGTQIIKSDHSTLIRFNSGDIYDDNQIISNYIATTNNTLVSSVVRERDNIAIDFNRAVITRKSLGDGELDDIAGTEVTIVYSNTGKVLETYDTKGLGETRKFIYVDDNTVHVDSSIYGYSKNSEEFMDNVKSTLYAVN